MRVLALVLICAAFLVTVTVPQQLHADAAPSGPFMGIFIGALVVGAIVLGVAVYHIFNAPAQGFTDLEFQEEEVVIELQDDCSRISCTFYIMNNGPSPYSGMFYFPFAVDETHPFPKELRVFHAVNGEVTEPAVERSGNRIYFRLTLPAEGRSILHVDYAQSNLEPEVTYIITSANDWHGPVGRATFRVHHPASWQEVLISYGPCSVAEQDGEVIHTVCLENLAPDEEFVISWKPER